MRPAYPWLHLALPNKLFKVNLEWLTSCGVVALFIVIRAKYSSILLSFVVNSHFLGRPAEPFYPATLSEYPEDRFPEIGGDDKVVLAMPQGPVTPVCPTAVALFLSDGVNLLLGIFSRTLACIGYLF